MRAARYYGKEDIRIERVDEPEPGPGEIKITPSHVGICGTDLHEYLGGPTFAPLPSSPHPITHDSIPITLGHEFSGVISSLGPGVSSEKFKPGQRVVIQPTLYCESCAACEAGIENVCHSAGFVGLSGGGGGLSEAVVVKERAVLPLPDNVPLDVGALVEPLSVAWHAISAAPLDPPNDTVLVLGGGPIGLAVLQCLKAKGVKRVIVAEVAKQRQVFAREFGADYVLDPSKDDVVALSKKYGDGEGPDVVFDCAGVPASIKTACHAVRARGWIVNVAIWEKDVPFNPNWLVFKEAKYTAALGYQKKDFEAVLAHLKDGSLKPEKMITRKIQLESLVKDGILALTQDKDNHVKILVEVGAK